MLDPQLRDEIGGEGFEYLASLRPSRIREVQAGRLGWTTVELVDVDSGHARALREGLELFGIRVNLTFAGTSRHVLAAFEHVAGAPYVVLACHGDEGRIKLPRLADELERFQPIHEWLGPDDVRRYARFDGSVVIATGCDTGGVLGEAFLDAGASAYVAPEGAPFGYASFFAPLFLFYELTEGRSLEEAVERLRAHDRELSMWRLFRGPAPAK